MTWDQVTALPCVDFLAWLDEHHRDHVVTALQRRLRHLSTLEVHEAWSMLLVYAWRQQFTASRFNSSDHVRPWCVSRMWNMLKFIWSNERQRRGFKGCVSRATEVLISELEQERFKQSMMDLARHRDDQPQRQALQLAPSEGWLSVLLDELTPRQRSAVEMLVLAGRTGLEAMELEPGCKRPQDFYRRKRDGLNACRRILGKRTFTDRHGDHFRIDDQGKFIAA